MEPKEALRQFLLAKIAAGSPEGAKLAERLANTDGPIEVAPEDVPAEFLALFNSNAQGALTATAVDISKLKSRGLCKKGGGRYSGLLLVSGEAARID